MGVCELRLDPGVVAAVAAQVEAVLVGDGYSPECVKTRARWVAEAIVLDQEFQGLELLAELLDDLRAGRPVDLDRRLPGICALLHLDPAAYLES